MSEKLPNRNRTEVIEDWGTPVVKEALAEDLEINKLIKRYNGDIGALQAAHNVEAFWGMDITSEGLKEAQERVEAVEEVFQMVPSEVRKAFKNDAGEFIDFATDPKNLRQMQDWGLVQQSSTGDLNGSQAEVTSDNLTPPPQTEGDITPSQTEV